MSWRVEDEKSMEEVIASYFESIFTLKNPNPNLIEMPSDGASLKVSSEMNESLLLFFVEDV